MSIQVPLRTRNVNCPIHESKTQNVFPSTLSATTSPVAELTRRQVARILSSTHQVSPVNHTNQCGQSRTFFPKYRISSTIPKAFFVLLCSVNDAKESTILTFLAVDASLE